MNDDVVKVVREFAIKYNLMDVTVREMLMFNEQVEEVITSDADFKNEINGN